MGGLVIKRPVRHAWSGSTAENGATKFDVTRAGRRSLNKGKVATNAHAIWRQVRRPTSGETLARSASARSSPAIGPVTALLRSRPFHAATPNSPAYVIKCSPIAVACSYASRLMPCYTSATRHYRAEHGVRLSHFRCHIIAHPLTSRLGK